MDPKINNMTVGEVTELINAVNHLNQYARAEKVCIFCENKDAIYNWKYDFIKKFSAMLHFIIRKIKVKTVCRGCDNGIYSYYEYDFDVFPIKEKCYKCHGTGIKELYFYEIEWVEFGIKWHVPFDKFPYYANIHLQEACSKLTDYTDEPNYQPNQPGRLLSPDEAAKYFLTCEKWLGYDLGKMLRFNIFIGSKDMGKCSLCGKECSRSGHVVLKSLEVDIKRPGIIGKDNLPGIVWLDNSCKECENSKHVWDHFTIPMELISNNPYLLEYYNKYLVEAVI